MHRTRTIRALRIAAAGLLLALAPSALTPAMAAEEATITAFAAWRGEGRVFDTGAEQRTFVGALEGTLYVETDKGPIASGLMLCPTIVTVDVKDRSQDGTGRCRIAAPEGDQIFAEIACKGYFLIGCEGDFTITGGTGKFAGVTGGGPVVIRSDFGQVKSTDGDRAGREATGILYLRGLHYKIP